MCSVRTLHFWALFDMRLQKTDLVAGYEFTCWTKLPRKVDVATFEADHELFESLILRLKKAARESAILYLQNDATLFITRCCYHTWLDVDISRGSFLLPAFCLQFFVVMSHRRLLLCTTHTLVVVEIPFAW